MAETPIKPALADLTPPLPAKDAGKLPLSGWAQELARRWNSGSYTVFLLHGNVFDLFPFRDDSGLAYVSLKTFLARRLFPARPFLLFYDVADGLTFATADMQKRFFEWLEVYDRVENTSWHVDGPPREFARLVPLLRRFFLHLADKKGTAGGVSLIIDFPEKIIPQSGDAFASGDERTALVTLLKWASSPEMRGIDLAVLLTTETAGEVHEDILRNPNIAQVRIDLPDEEERLRFLQSRNMELLTEGREPSAWSDLSQEELARRLSGLNILRMHHLLAEAIKNGVRITMDQVSASKKTLIEEFCQGLVRFKNPKPGLSLETVATHAAAKQKLRELAWLFRNNKTDVVEKGVLLPGRVGVGKSFLVDCFASDCGLPVMELGEFRSKWVGDTELQLARILLTIKALGPVIVVVDEADAVFGTREGDAGDSGISARVFATLAAHIGDSALRGRELWIAMTSRPDLLTIDMKRQGRFGLSVPLFPAQNADEVMELFTTVARVRKVVLPDEGKAFIREKLGDRPLTGSDVESILVRAKERAVLEKRDDELRTSDLCEAVDSFIDPLDPALLSLQELAAVLACSDRRYLPERWREADRAALREEFERMKRRLGR